MNKEIKMNTIKSKIDEINNVFNKIDENKAEEVALLVPLQNEIKEIRKTYEQKNKKEELFLSELKEKYSDYARDLAVEKNKCPYARNGSYLNPSDIEINKDGLVLEWIEERQYGCDNYTYFEASWSDLLEYENRVV